MTERRQIFLDQSANGRPDRWWAALALVLMVVSLVEGLGLAAGGALHANDLKHLWGGAWLLARGGDPYDAALLFGVAREQGWGSINPYVYLPTTGLMLRPLAGLEFEPARLCWFWLNWGLAWVVVLAGPRLLGVGRPGLARLAGAAFLVAAMPFYRQQTAGQMNVVMAGLILLAAWGVRRRRDWLVGAALAAGFGWKIAPALMVAALAPMRRWRALAWGAGLSLTLLGVSVGVYGWPLHARGFEVIGQMGYGRSTWAEYGAQFHRDPFNQAPGALMHHLFVNDPAGVTRPWLELGAEGANVLTLMMAGLLGAAWLAAAIGGRRAGGERRDVALLLAASLLMLLVPSILWDHYVVQALPALAWVFGDPRTARRPWRAAAALGLLVLLAIPWDHQAESLRWGAGLLLMPLRLWPLLVLYGWLVWEAGLDWRRKEVRG